MESVSAFGNELIGMLFDPGQRLSALYLVTAIGLGVVLWLFSGRTKSLRDWLIPREVYTHRSNLLDIKLFIANKFFAFVGLFGALFFPAATAFSTLTLLSRVTGSEPSSMAGTWTLGLIATVIIVMATDFCKYWAHRWHHELRALWPFHAVHHSADVLTPLTVMRSHPVETMIRNLLISAIVGMVQGIVLFVLIGKIDIVTIGGANALYFIFNALGANLRHSHIWLSYGRVMEHIFISPAQHQIHHSVAVEHHDKNYGSMFALWDWMFGTLYIPQQREELRFGVSDAEGNPKPQPYETLGAALFKPFKESWVSLRGEAAEKPPAPAPASGTMTPGFSLWLDALRAAAALLVLFGHMAHIRFTRGDYYFLRDINIASDAVILFFVLSGVVIAYAAGRDGTLARFAFNRMTRLYSVIIPALILTVIFDAIGTRITMEAYPEDYYQPLPLAEMFWRGLSFTSEWQGAFSDRLRLGTNGPLWSLSYEVGFYLMFGIAMFLTGVQRIVLLALMAVLVGLPILALLPAWALGVFVWRFVRSGTVISDTRAWMLAIGSVVALVVLRAAGLPALLTQITIDAVAPIYHHALLGYSDEVLWNSIIAIAVALHLVGVSQIAARRVARPEGGFARAIRWVAGASFSLYVMHYPTLHLLDAALPETLPMYDLWLLGLTLAMCFGFAALFERPLKQLRQMVRTIWGSMTTPRPRDADAATGAR
ncbi:sterol desaturase family protein [Arenibacterium sp. CAU 1754]